MLGVPENPKPAKRGCRRFIPFGIAVLVAALLVGVLAARAR